jgi:hypothetical protein
MNAQGVELERRYRRPILAGLHAAHPLVTEPSRPPGTARLGRPRCRPGRRRPGRPRRRPAATSLPPPVAIAVVTTLGYLGSFTGPPLVGALAELTGLSAALILLVAAATLPVLLARRACGDPSSTPA